MDKIGYLSNSTTQKNGAFPVTIQGLDFIQSQILTLQKLAFSGGDNYVIKEPDSQRNGIIVWDGEVLPLVGPVSNYIQLVKRFQSISTDSDEYKNVREIRTAEYTYRNMNTVQTAELRPRAGFETIKTNEQLWAEVQKLLALPDGESIPVKRGVFSLLQLNTKQKTARIVCDYGSANIFGYNTYTVDVNECRNADGTAIVYQELQTADLRRFGRTLTDGVWSEFAPIDDQLNLEAKVIRGQLWLRHGYLPPYAKIILLRKKRRGKDAGKGRKDRTVKCAWCHGWKMEFSKGIPNTWYIPKCIYAEDPRTGKAWSTAVGDEFAPLIHRLLFQIIRIGQYEDTWRILGVQKNWKKPHKRAYAKLALAVICNRAGSASAFHDIANSEMMRIKYRVWDDKKLTASQMPRITLSVE